MIEIHIDSSRWPGLLDHLGSHEWAPVAVLIVEEPTAYGYEIRLLGEALDGKAILDAFLFELANFKLRNAATCPCCLSTDIDWMQPRGAVCRECGREVAR